MRTDRSIARCALVSGLMAVGHPFAHIAQHVVQAKGIRFVFAGGRVFAVAIVALMVRPHIHHVGFLAGLVMGVGEFASLPRSPAIRRLTPEPGSRGPGAHGVFEFRFAQQSAGPAGGLAQPLRIGTGLGPRNIDHRIVAAPEAVILGRRTASGRCAGVPLLECQFIFAHTEVLGKPDLVLGFFIGMPALGQRRTHHKFAGRHDDHFRTGRAIAKFAPGRGVGRQGVAK